MREILFRGKRTDNGEWAKGFYGRKGADAKTYKHYIVSPVFNPHGTVYDTTFYFTDIEIDPATVGEYTGLRDTNGKRIFEGDIISLNGGAYEIKFENGRFYIAGTCYPGWCISKAEVIGNVYDNPELIERQADNG